ncbi:PREDICTED: uncharacterized protein LOC108567571 isoform X2 [Nicrophorus vespilloides]|uniref:Uncharacterized protein LOC108567571 isoform X2 n=1 Tax=Nicrophorus vespilloides TaxID=110193 RepID=A0ABM1N9V3_NICVS|nr:PREDICTED: uncharacterized protein LOC108567571 isoform X2 [Nicrophorus vespilloides]
MEDIAFSDWPGQHLDLAGSNPWLPAYGFQQPHTLLDKDDFLGNPDAELFLHGSSPPYAYLETIQEETSDDLRSESDLSESEASPAGWLATDSESGSVIRIHAIDLECESDREVACPAKRRRQDIFLSDDESCHSLSRSSSLLQFENLEKQCQEISSSSPSIFSSFSYDSLERKGNVSPDSLDRDIDSDYYRTLKIDGLPKKCNKSRDSLFYNNSNNSSDCSADSEETLEAARYDSTANLKTWRSFDGLHSNTHKVKVSVENLSEDSGYSDHFYVRNKSSSIPNMVVVQHERVMPERSVYKTQVQIGGDFEHYRKSKEPGFCAYDGEVSGKFSSNFGISYHDLSNLEYRSSPLIDRFMRNGAAKRRLADAVNIDKASECCVASKYNTVASASEPNLLSNATVEHRTIDNEYNKQDYFEGAVCVSSVPKDLNLAGDLGRNWSQNFSSIAATNCNLSDIIEDKMPKLSRYQRAEYGDKITIRLKYDTSSISSASDIEPSNTSFKREGSYLEAMTNSIDSDEDFKPHKKKILGEFDRQILKAISETSIQSFGKSAEKLDTVFTSTPICKENRNVKSTPDLAAINFEHRKLVMNRSTSTSGVSEDEKNLKPAKSFSGSSGSKGVHFSPVVAEVNWRDSVSTERESSYSLSSSPEPEVKVSSSQPELKSPNWRGAEEVGREIMKELARSQPEIGGANVYHSPTPHNHVAIGNQQVKADKQNKPVLAMEPVVKQQQHLQCEIPNKATKPNKFGGFFSRIASFRFSSRKNDEKKKKKIIEHPALKPTGQRLATKDDYIYIPLKGPDEKINNNINKVQVDGLVLDDGVSGKPPMPPRVVGACVKQQRRQEAASTTLGAVAHGQRPDHRRTIDSGLPRPMEPMGLIETDLDTEVTVITSGAHAKTRSLMNLGAEAPHQHQPLSLAAPEQHRTHRPHKSMEFLLDKQNLKVVEPPENELQKGGERVMSEQQLRVQRSLQKLNVPDWYKQGQVPREGFLLNKKTQSARESRWQGTGGSKTTSLNSLGSTSQSPVALSPTALHTQPFVRWSTSKLNSTASSPCASTRSSFNARQPNGSISPSSLRSSFSYRQPYLGWRSQERLTRTPRTPAERLANSILSQQPTQENQEIQSSIKEVTSAIVHYVSGLRPEDGREHSYDSQETASQRSRSVSPRGSQKLCWVESSFVGTRPLDSPQTPITLTESPPMPPTTLRLDLQHNDVSLLSTGGSRKPSPSSTTLEDVLDSLLGLPSSTRAPSPSLQETASASTSPVRRQGEQFRRRSEGSEPTSQPPSSTGRRSSFHSSPVLRCKYGRCGRTAVAKSNEGQAYKNCHNCSYTYCSRTCRRSHWEKHRKTCLFSRVGTLCRQVIAAAKEQDDTLQSLSVIARRGFLSHGPGAVKIFFPCPESADKFLLEGLQSLGDPTYVRWQDLLPSEMGPQLYAELVKMCKNYNPDAKLVLYVSVCVISEAPAAGAVKWERQLVSRCGKMRLSKNIHIPDNPVDNPETLILTSPPIKEPQQGLREISFNNIEKHLRQRGVSLKKHYPKIYQQLCNYVDGTCKFAPVTVYPRDSSTGKTFMCIIMPDVEPECVNKLTTAGVRVRTVNLLQDPEPDQT